MAINTATLVLVCALATIVLCQVVQSAPPHMVFHTRGDEDAFHRPARKMPPFALFGIKDQNNGAEDEMWRNERKAPPYVVFAHKQPRYGFERDARVVPPYVVFGEKQRTEHGKRNDEDFPLN